MRQPTDREILQRLVPGDEFFDRKCYRCLHHSALFYLRGKLVGMCPECVQERVAMLELELGGLPDDIEIFRQEAEREVAFQDRKEDEALSVDWNYLAKCHRCGHLVETYEIRYPRPLPGTNQYPPYCYACTLVCREEDRCLGKGHAPVGREGPGSGSGRGAGAGAERGSGSGGTFYSQSGSRPSLLGRAARWVVNKLEGFPSIGALVRRAWRRVR